MFIARSRYNYSPILTSLQPDAVGTARCAVPAAFSGGTTSMVDKANRSASERRVTAPSLFSVAQAFLPAVSPTFLSAGLSALPFGVNHRASQAGKHYETAGRNACATTPLNTYAAPSLPHLRALHEHLTFVQPMARAVFHGGNTPLDTTAIVS
jgi:hypothetical protein